MNSGVGSLLSLVGVSTWDEGDDCGPSWPLLQAAILVEIEGLVPVPAFPSQLGQLLIPAGLELSWRG